MIQRVDITNAIPSSRGTRPIFSRAIRDSTSPTQIWSTAMDASETPASSQKDPVETGKTIPVISRPSAQSLSAPAYSMNARSTPQ